MAPTLQEVPLVDAAGDELRALLSPVTPETFVHEHWGRKPLFVKGFPEKYRGLFSREAFINALAQPGPAAPDFLRASFDKKDGASSAKAPAGVSSTAFNATPDQAVPLFKAGATLCATQIETRVAGLARFSAAIKRQLGYPGRVTFNAYLSPPGAGFNWHFDGRIASTLQIEGTKRWRFSNSAAVAWPRGNGVVRADGAGQYVDPRAGVEAWEQLAPFDEKDTTEVLLEPGDLLILPAGAWHDARGGDGGSLALNLSFTPISYGILVRELLDGLLSAQPGWRGPAPLLPLEGGLPGEVDARGLEAMAAELTRAADALRTLATDNLALVGLWSSFVQATGFGGPDVRVPGAAPVVESDRLRVRADGQVYARLAEGRATLCVFFGAGGRIDVTGADIGLVQRLLSARAFTAGECLAWGQGQGPTAWAEVQTTLTELVRQGLLERVAA